MDSAAIQEELAYYRKQVERKTANFEQLSRQCEEIAIKCKKAWDEIDCYRKIYDHLKSIGTLIEDLEK